MIIFNKLETIDQIKLFDKLVISDGNEIILTTVSIVKVSDYDGTEIIYDIKKNKYFNVGMYLEGKSWAKCVYVVEACNAP